MGWGSGALNIDYVKVRDQRDARREQIKQEQLRTRQIEYETDSMQLKFQQLQKEFDDQLDAQFFEQLREATADGLEGKPQKLLSLLTPIPTDKNGNFTQRVSPARLKMFGNSFADIQKYLDGVSRQRASGNPNARPEELGQQRYDGLEQWMRMDDEQKRKYANKYRQYKQQKLGQQNTQADQNRLGPQAKQPMSLEQAEKHFNAQGQTDNRDAYNVSSKHIKDEHTKDVNDIKGMFNE